eukprot:SAG31_NODE_28130_length_415_cov_0.658228_1_plen_71_part_01
MTALCRDGLTFGGCSQDAELGAMSKSDGLSTVPSSGRRLGHRARVRAVAPSKSSSQCSAEAATAPTSAALV